MKQLLNSNYLLTGTLLLILSSCGVQKEKTSFKEIKKEVSLFNHRMLVSGDRAHYTHVASVAPSTVNNYALQATGMDKDGNLIFISYNTQGEAVRGGLDVVELSSQGQPTLKASFVSNTSEYAEVKYKNGFLYLVGQKVGLQKNDAVLTVVNIADPTSPRVASELIFEDGWYATSIDIESNKAYISVPNIGLKIVDISSPNSIVLEKTEYLKSEEKITLNSSGSTIPLLPERFSLISEVSNETSDTWNHKYRHRYQIKFKHNFPNHINGTPYYSNWELCFNSTFAIGNEGLPWNSNILDLGNGKYKITPKTAQNGNLWYDQYMDIGWNTVLSSPLGNRRITDIKLTVDGSDCSVSESKMVPQFDNSLFVRRFDGKNLVLGGDVSTKIIFNENSQNRLVVDINSQPSEAPSRFVVKDNTLYTNAGYTGLSIVGNLNSTPDKKSNISLPGTGNGITIDECGQAYLAQGEEGVIVTDVRDLASPIQLGIFDYADDLGSANNVFRTKIENTNHIVVSDGRGGIKIIKVVLPYGCN